MPRPPPRKWDSSHYVLHLFDIVYHLASPETDGEGLFTLPSIAGGCAKAANASASLPQPTQTAGLYIQTNKMCAGPRSRNRPRQGLCRPQAQRAAMASARRSFFPLHSLQPPRPHHTPVLPGHAFIQGKSALAPPAQRGAQCAAGAKKKRVDFARPSLCFVAGELYCQEQHLREEKRSSYSPPVAEWSNRTTKPLEGAV